MITKEIFSNIITIVSLNGLILIIPGVSFFLIARHALLGGLLLSFYCVIGVTVAIMLHAALAAFSVSVLLKSYPVMFSAIRYSGAAYLLYLGTRFLIASLKNNVDLTSSKEELSVLSKHRRAAFYAGFLTDFFNPFISIFYLSLFSMLGSPLKTVFEFSCYFAIIFVITIGWFSLVAKFFANSLFQGYFQDKHKYIQFISGVSMYYFGSKVVIGF